MEKYLENAYVSMANETDVDVDLINQANAFEAIDPLGAPDDKAKLVPYLDVTSMKHLSLGKITGGVHEIFKRLKFKGAVSKGVTDEADYLG